MIAIVIIACDLGLVVAGVHKSAMNRTTGQKKCDNGKKHCDDVAVKGRQLRHDEAKNKRKEMSITLCAERKISNIQRERGASES
jgi:hypothetical protein